MTRLMRTADCLFHECTIFSSGRSCIGANNACTWFGMIMNEMTFTRVLSKCRNAVAISWAHCWRRRMPEPWPASSHSSVLCEKRLWYSRSMSALHGNGCHFEPGIPLVLPLLQQVLGKRISQPECDEVNRFVLLPVREAILREADVSVRIEKLHARSGIIERNGGIIPPLLLKDIVEEQVRPAVITAVRALIIQAPIVRKVSDVVLAAGGKLAHRLRRVTGENFRNTTDLIEVRLEPFEDARNLHLLFARRKFVEILARKPGSIGAIILFFKLIAGVSGALERRATARRADQHRVCAVAD